MQTAADRGPAVPAGAGTLLLIDGSSVAHRAFYALPALTDAGGRPTNAVYGFALMLLKLLEDDPPTHLAVVFDAGKTVFRHALYAEYKGTREKSPPELVEQLPLVRALVGAFGLPLIEREGYEADDLIGTLADRAARSGYAVRILSSDRDLLQLLGPRVSVGLTRKGVTEIDWMTEDAFRAAYGIAPAQFVDVKALMGDASDNIPGVPGVGEKTALKLIAEYGTLDGVYAHLAEIRGKLRERLEAHREAAYLSRKLAAIERGVPLDVEPDALRLRPPKAAALEAFFRDVGFRSLLDRARRLAAPEAEPAAASPPDEAPPTDAASPPVEAPGAKGGSIGLLREAAAAAPDVLEGAEAAEAAAAHLPRPAALVLELDGENPHRARIAGGAIAGDGRLVAFSPAALAAPAFRRWLEDPAVEKIAYDAKRTFVALARAGLRPAGIADDLLLMQYLLDATRGAYTLADLARSHGLELPDDEAVYGKGARFRLPPPERLYPHLAAKARALAAVRGPTARRLQALGMTALYREVELPLAFVLAEMELAGVAVDRATLEAYGAELDAKIAAVAEEIFRAVGVRFNLNSPKQLGEILFDKLGIPPLKKTKTGYSTDAETLEKLAPYHPVIPKLLDYRLLTKLRSTYIDGLVAAIHDDGKIHTTFHQALTATGRLSSSDPNLQNIPVRVEEGRKIRKAFVPSEAGFLILSADYSQIELRVLAHFSGDPKLVDAFHRDEDIHTQTAMDVFGLSREAVTPLHRRQAKAVNFGIIYGISDYGLSQNLGIGRKEAAAFIERYFATYPDVKRYLDEAVARARERGYVETLFGRRRELSEIRDKNFARRSFAERAAMNTPIQGTAADIIKKAMLDVDRALRSAGLRARMLLQVHDELVFEVAEADAPALAALVKERMEQAARLRVPLKVEVAVGPTWYDAK
ncbi:DNA polymerase I [Hydrogenibacillus schlegelii]|uniref:DNA polymerase I n=2 Tax=Hydrogenibacillus schlegelii TaxID=1484 RepID=A0A179INY5_HYDSH|nr:DNA polymerase I [Hydrogenibacillus schlegelii]